MKINLKTISRHTIGIFFVLTGIAHFFVDGFLITIIPDIIPFKKFLVYSSGLYEFIIGSMMLLSPYKKIAAWGMVILLIAVFPVHIFMLIEQERFSQIPAIFFPIRIVIQFIFIYWAYSHTKE